jgi:hypothetical protein
MNSRTALYASAAVAVAIAGSPMVIRAQTFHAVRRTTENWINDEWVYTWCSTQDYDAYGYSTLSEGFRWDSTAQDWDLNIRQRHTYEYDAYGNQIFAQTDMWDMDSGVYVPMMRNDAVYDRDGNWLGGTHELWDKDSSVWEYNQRMDLTYDHAGNRLEWLFQKWDDGLSRWVNFMYYRYDAHDAEGRPLDWTYHRWGEPSNGWNRLTRYLYVFDSTGHVDEQTLMQWDTTAKAWVNQTQYDFVRDSCGNIVEQTRSTWDTAQDAWVQAGRYRMDNTIDGYCNPTVIVTQQWNATLGDWENQSRVTIEYDMVVDASRRYAALRTRAAEAGLSSHGRHPSVRVSLPGRSTVSVRAYSLLGRLAGSWQGRMDAGDRVMSLPSRGGAAGVRAVHVDIEGVGSQMAGEGGAVLGVVPVLR